MRLGSTGQLTERAPTPGSADADCTSGLLALLAVLAQQPSTAGFSSSDEAVWVKMWGKNNSVWSKYLFIEFNFHLQEDSPPPVLTCLKKFYHFNYLQQHDGLATLHGTLHILPYTGILVG
jgi:hypothetical protein